MPLEEPLCFLALGQDLGQTLSKKGAVCLWGTLVEKREATPAQQRLEKARSSGDQDQVFMAMHIGSMREGMQELHAAYAAAMSRMPSPELNISKLCG